MKVIRPNQSEWVNEVKKHITGGIHKIGYVIIECPVARVYRKTQVDENTCKTLGYEVVEYYHNGGTIIANTGDIVFGHLGDLNNEWLNRFIIYFVEWLKLKGLNAIYEDNDILVDGFKVCGLCITRYGRIDFSGGFIGINTKLDHIKAICRKPMKKVPKGLSEYGITTEEVEQMFLEFCEKGDTK